MLENDIGYMFNVTCNMCCRLALGNRSWVAYVFLQNQLVTYTTYLLKYWLYIFNAYIYMITWYMSNLYCLHLCIWLRWTWMCRIPWACNSGRCAVLNDYYSHKMMARKSNAFHSVLKTYFSMFRFHVVHAYDIAANVSQLSGLTKEQLGSKRIVSTTNLEENNNRLTDDIFTH